MQSPVSMEGITSPPDLSSFRSAAEHHAQTPTSFFSGPAVLHHRAQSAQLIVPQAEARLSAALAAIVGLSASESASASSHLANGNSHPNGSRKLANGVGSVSGNGTDEPLNGSDDASGHGQNATTCVVDDVDIWVASDKFILFRPSISRGLTIPYPQISLHALQTLPTPPAIASPGQAISSSNVDDSAASGAPTQGLYLQISLTSPLGSALGQRAHNVTDGDNDDGDDESFEPTVTITIVPRPVGSLHGVSDAVAPPVATDPTSTPNADAVSGETASQSASGEPASTSHPNVGNSTSSPALTLFEAVSTCASLHPDPATQDDDESMAPGSRLGAGPSFLFEDSEAPGGTDGNGITSISSTAASGLPPPMPGSSGWITAENLSDFFDENGNWRGPGLGPGAGIVRVRQDSDDAAAGQVDDTEEIGQAGTGQVHGSEFVDHNGSQDTRADGETKWRRTD